MGNREKRVQKKKVMPVSLEILTQIKKGLQKMNLKKLSKLSVWALCLVAFWGAFRLGEILAKNKTKFDKFSDLLWKDILFDNESQKITIRIKSAKIPGAPGNLAELFKIKNPSLCPVTALRRLFKHQKKSGSWGAELPIFRRASGKNLTKSSFLKTTDLALKNMGLTKITLGSKSFRSGMLSALKTLPPEFQEKHLKLLGRWKGDSYKFYMWNGPVPFSQTFKTVSEQLLKNLNCRRGFKTPVVPSESPQQRQRRR